ncbi:Zinc finger, RING-type [Sesbania bispinosa]|nr:Zinc finger, RING-type [Sesbania bispinosa]
MDSEEDSPHGSSSSSHSEETYLVGFVLADIVGLKYYAGTISGREMVGLVREPLNPHDPNAIKVFNTRTEQVGHIERSVAAVLSPLIDSELITVEGIVPNSRSTATKFRMPCQVHIFAQFSSFPVVIDAFSESPLHLISNSHPSFTLSDSIAVKETRADDSFKNLNAIFKLVNEHLAAKDCVLEPLLPPPSVIKSELLQHQKEALGWLVHRENSVDLPPFWEQRDAIFVNVLTNFLTDSRPEPLRGGIFADAMGLGKTLTLLSLIAFDKWEKMESGNKKRKRLLASSSDDDSLEMETEGTLVICPPSVISTWVLQLEEHTHHGALKTYMYYGDRRTRKAKELKQYDLVLTTYSTLAVELPYCTPVNMLKWRRIILDEAHTIKNINAAQSRAVIELKAKRRWAVTGTPIQNGSFDLYSLMAFLHFEPFSVKSYWQRLVQRPLNQGKDGGLTRLQVLMGAISLRRTKEMALVGLPPKTVETYYIALSCEERRRYDEVKEEVKALLIQYEEDRNTLVNGYSAILSMILRLRQICTDYALCPSNFKSHLLPSSDIEDVSKNPELLQALVRVLQDGDDFDCPICISPPTDIIITCCAHIFCRDCILKTLKRSNPRCPLCRRSLSESDLFSAPPETPEVDITKQSSSETRVSTKVSTLIKLLTESRDQHPTVKSVVFSQFRKLLVFLEEPLKEAGFKTLRLDGSMNAKHRARVIEQFQVSGKDEPMVLLASLKASSLGINLTAASRVYLMEPWWNPGVEEQAMDRVHRIGQKEDVKVVRFVALNSIEEKILMLQEKKKELAEEGCRRGSKDVLGMGINDLRFIMEE